MNKLLEKVLDRKMDCDFAKIKEDAKMNNRDMDYIIQHAYVNGVHTGCVGVVFNVSWHYFKVGVGIVATIHVINTIQRIIAAYYKTQDAGNQKV